MVKYHPNDLIFKRVVEEQRIIKINAKRRFTREISRFHCFDSLHPYFIRRATAQQTVSLHQLAAAEDKPARRPLG